MTFWISSERRTRISRDVPGGAVYPIQAPMCTPESAASAIVGTSGMPTVRRANEVAECFQSAALDVPDGRGTVSIV